MKARAPLALLVTVGVLALVATILVAVTIGPANLGVAEVARSIAHHLGFAVGDVPRLHDAIVWDLRLPRVITAAAVGAGLALAGAVMQSLTRNPLADPYLLGLSSGASLGAVAVLVVGVSLLLPVAAFAGAILALLVTLTLARSGGTLAPGRTVLAGLAVSQFAAAGTSFVIFWTATGDSYREILNWLLGSLAGSTWSDVAIAGIAVVVIGVVLLMNATRLDAFAFGDTSASALGIDVNRTRWTLMIVVALLTGAMVAVSGAIGFVGLILPHAVSSLTGPAHRRLLPVAGLAGAIFLVWADTIARTVFDPRELPVGIVTALVGVPVFAFLLRRGEGVGMDLILQAVGTRLAGRWVVDGVDATPPTGALTGLLGPNGAGKTTLLRMIAGLISPEAGAVLVGSENVETIPRRTRARRIALLEQESTSSVPLTVREVVALGRIPYRTMWGSDPDDAAVDRALASARAEHLADRAWWSLSGGERQRVQIARALAQEPDLLLLDEPTNHLDVSAQLSLLAFVRDLGTTTVAALHDLNLAAAFCEHVLVLKDGHLAAAGHPGDVLTPDLLREVYAVEADILSNPKTGRPVIAFHEPEQP